MGLLREATVAGIIIIASILLILNSGCTATESSAQHKSFENRSLRGY